MALTQQQLDFLKKHLNYDGQKKRKQKSLGKDIQEFWRRRDKALEALKVLAPNHPARTGLQQRLDAANTKAEGGNLKGAYKDLKQIKIDARREAETTKRGISAAPIRTALQGMMIIADRQKNFHDAAAPTLERRADDIVAHIAQLDKLQDATSRDDYLEKFRLQQDAVSGIRAELAALDQSVKSDIDHWKRLLALKTDWKVALDSAAHNLTLLTKANPKSVPGDLSRDLTVLTVRVKDMKLDGNGAELQKELEGRLREIKLEVDSLLAEKTASPDFSSQTSLYTNKDGSEMSPADQKKAAKDMADRFAHLETREKERFARAEVQFLQLVRQDQVLNQKGNRVNRQVEALETFDTGEFLEDLALDLAEDGRGIEGMMAAAVPALSQHMDALMNANPDSDEMFDLGVRTDDDWRKEVKAGLGLPDTPDDEGLSEIEKALVRGLSEEMARLARDKYPNKMAEDMQSFDLNGVTYGDIEKLGSGGGGTVYKCKDPLGNVIVLKMPNHYDPEESNKFNQEEYAKEARNHRRVTGGEDHDVHENILDMKGIVLGPDGTPLIAMDLADAGDAEAHTQSIKSLGRTGVIDESAQKALMADTMRQIVKGLKAMHDQSMTHFDMKEANVFMMSDGTLKVADFGEGIKLDGPGETVESKTGTKGFMAPEMFTGGGSGQKADTFSVGVMLDLIMNEMSHMGRSTGFSGIREQTMDDEGEVVTQSSLDRLRNAMLEPDPDKRPSLEAILMSSFLTEDSVNYTDEDLKELREATASYNAKTGRALSKINVEIEWLLTEIQGLELKKRSLPRKRDIKKARREIATAEFGVERWTEKLNWAENDKERAKAQSEIDGFTATIVKEEAKIARYETENGKPLTRDEKNSIDKEIDQKRKEIKGFESQIEEINEDPAIKPLVDRMKAANAPFGARG